jgi:hypothetical protein
VALVGAVVFTTAGAVLAALQSAYMAALSAAILLVSVAPFLLPTHYALTEDGVEERRAGRTRTRRWAELRRLSVGKDAALVSPFAKRSWLDRSRGIVLFFDGGDREQIVSILRAKVTRE